MKLAVISDLHSNLEAVDAVFVDIAAVGVDAIYCLGDVVGYGPDPSPCIDRARACKINLKGNHDDAVLAWALGFNPMAREAIEWTRRELRPPWHGLGAKKDRWEFLQGLATSHEENEILFVHGSPRDPFMEYILPSDVEDIFGEVPKKIREIFEMVKQVCFVGHTHLPGVIEEGKARFFSPDMLGGEYVVKQGLKAIVNVGSVGQPRDGDPRSCYVVWDGQVARYRRVTYDFRRVQEKIFANPHLDKRSGERLERGE